MNSTTFLIEFKRRRTHSQTKDGQTLKPTKKNMSTT